MLEPVVTTAFLRPTPLPSVEQYQRLGPRSAERLPGCPSTLQDRRRDPLLLQGAHRASRSVLLLPPADLPSGGGGGRSFLVRLQAVQPGLDQPKTASR